jgi:hypothetical protein
MNLPRCYLAYLTANDSPHYQADFLHFQHMARLHPGVDRVTVFIAISRVSELRAVDRVAMDELMAIADQCPWLDVRAVFWKGNVGRDFSSAEACLNAIGAEAHPDDYVMVRNRSAYGPSRENWYRQYVDQYQCFPNTGLVGSTINFLGHPRRPSDGPTTHVQTYAYLSQWRHFEPLRSAYPASRCVDRLELIHEGEIGLSRSMLERGLALSCLYWPDQVFTLSRLNAPGLAQEDIKKNARALSLRYKYPSYFWQPLRLASQLAWSLRLRRAHQPQRATRHVELTQYG